MTRDPGVYSRDQLRALGWTGLALRNAVRNGELTRLRPGWHAQPGADPAVATAVGNGGALSCVSALKWHGLWVAPGYPQTHVRRSRTAAGRGRTCTAEGWRPSVTSAVDPIPVALTCATRCMSAEHWVAACDSYLNKFRLTAADVRAQVGKLTPRIRKLLDWTDGRSQSGTESIVRFRLRQFGYKVIVQPRVAGVGHTDLRIGMLIIECDSMAYHSDSEAYQRDRVRDRKAAVDGWITIRLTYDDVLYGWDEVRKDIEAITRADRHRARSRRTMSTLQRSGQDSSSEVDLPSAAES